MNHHLATTILPLVFATLVSLVYILSNKFQIRHKENKQKIISFAAGVSITYLLLDFYPRFTEGALEISNYLFLAVLFGFTIHHIIEKEIYLHHHKHGLVKMLTLEENIFSYVYHVVVGIVLVYLTKISIFDGTLYFATILAYTFVSTLPTKPHSSHKLSFMLASSTILGAVLGLLLAPVMPVWTQFLLMGLAIGVLLFTVVRHHIPFGRHGRVDYFILGFIMYAVLILFSWLL